MPRWHFSFRARAGPMARTSGGAVLDAARALMFACAAWLIGCERETYDSYGLATAVAIHVNIEDQAIMLHATYAKTQVPAEVIINGQSFFARVNIAGATSVNNLKKSYDLELDAPFRGRQTYRLSAMAGDATAMRALLAFRVFAIGGLETPAAEPVAVWINHEYAGLYLLLEKVDAAFFHSRGDAPITLYQAENGIATMRNTNELEIQFSTKIGGGDMGDLRELIALVNEAPGDDNRARLETYAHVDKILAYMAVVSYIRHWDGVQNNFYLARTRDHPRFCIIPWDLDKTFMDNVPMADGEIFEGNRMMLRFFYEDAPYRRRIEEHYRQISEIAATPVLIDYVERLVSTLGEAYAADPFLSGPGISLEARAESLKELITALTRRVRRTALAAPATDPAERRPPRRADSPPPSPRRARSGSAPHHLGGV